jgi:glycosyltransferase involved in cell wall biosynthesis
LIFSTIILLFIIATVIQLFFLFILRYKKQFNNPNPFNSPVPVSIIICAKNEAVNLSQFLPFVLEQDYPEHLFEVIVVNDQSTDHSTEILSQFAHQYPQLKIVSIASDIIKTLPGKKYALAEGIKVTKHDRILLTDADCKPSSDQWLKEMVNTDAEIMLGYGAYEEHPGLLNKFIRWETANTCMQYASYAHAGMTYMGVGRNLSYRKSLLTTLEQDTAFQQIYKSTPSGDDDLLISKIAGKDNVAVCLEKKAHTISIPQKTWNAWWKQKTRHASTGKYYPQKIKNLLGLYGLSHSLYWFSGLMLIILQLANCELPIANYWVFALFFARLFIYWINAATWYRQLNEKKLLLFYPIGDLGWALYNVFLSPYIFWKNRQAWK